MKERVQQEQRRPAGQREMGKLKCSSRLHLRLIWLHHVLDVFFPQGLDDLIHHGRRDCGGFPKITMSVSKSPVSFSLSGSGSVFVSGVPASGVGDYFGRQSTTVEYCSGVTSTMNMEYVSIHACTRVHASAYIYT
jgi:hypothetical protein